ncbi:FHA domain containing protein [Labilithrix luteola]|uniref:FHA domain containing protein n=1 Tax=Labilithrix luteola TaxID=1391654 RepID=A0A0K1QBE5_9BACT|nr:FHA domain-containing protein [Labilithrix luteola]AKV03058.1 FHA domain containing protein [Labilithrix luteola]
MRKHARSAAAGDHGQAPGHARSRGASRASRPVRPVGSSASAGGPAVAPAPGFPAIAPNRVVELGGGSPAPARAPRTCGRCRGTVDPGAQFCKFCGAPLADAEPAVERPPVVARPADVAPLLPHERLELPKAAPNATPPQPAEALVRPATAPTPAVAPPATSPPAQPAQPAQPVQPSAPRALTRGRLVVIAKSGADGPSYPVGDTLDIGRTEGNVVVGEDPYLSPRHVRIAWTGTKLVLRDLASTNGVYLRLSPARDMNAVRRTPGGRGAHPEAEASSEVAVPLQDQDLILVGQQVLKFEVVPNSFDAGLGPAVEHSTLLFGSPAAPRYARLGQRTVEGITRDVYYVRKMETVLGRESGDIVFTEDPFLSRRHAAVRVLGRDGAPLAPSAKPTAEGEIQFALVDLGSSNGTFLRIRGEVDLVSGDHFRVGQQLFRIDFEAPGQRAGDDGVRAG